MVVVVVLVEESIVDWLGSYVMVVIVDVDNAQLAEAHMTALIAAHNIRGMGCFPPAQRTGCQRHRSTACICIMPEQPWQHWFSTCVQCMHGDSVYIVCTW